MPVKRFRSPFMGGRGYNKQMPLYYDEFSDLSPDWPMILVGWRGFSHRKLSAEQVIAHALEQIGRGTAEQDEVAALLANTDPSEWQTIDRHLIWLAGPEGLDRVRPLRRWRLAELKQLLASLSRPEERQSAPKDEEQKADELWSLFCKLYEFWREYDELPDSVAAQPKSAEAEEKMLADQQAWVEREEAALRGVADRRL